MINGIVIYSRMGSSRLPGKATKMISSYPLLEHIVLRLKGLVGSIENLKIIIATTINFEDDIICEIARKLDVVCFRGHPTDLVDRTSSLIKQYKLDAFCRVNGDCPFVDVNLLLEGFDILKNSNFQIVTNIFKRTYPYGVAVEWIDAQSFLLQEKNVKDIEREHVTMHLYKYIPEHQIYNLENNFNLSHLKLAVDTHDDLIRIRNYFESARNINNLELKYNQINN